MVMFVGLGIFALGWVTSLMYAATNAELAAKISLLLLVLGFFVTVTGIFMEKFYA